MAALYRGTSIPTSAANMKLTNDLYLREQNKKPTIQET